MLRVRNMESENGNKIVNQFILESDKEKCFQSYESICAMWNKRKKSLTIGRDALYSTTTAKYLYRFIREEISLYCVDRKFILKVMDLGKVNIGGCSIIYDPKLI